MLIDPFFGGIGDTLFLFLLMVVHFKFQFHLIHFILAVFEYLDKKYVFPLNRFSLDNMRRTEDMLTNLALEKKNLNIKQLCNGLKSIIRTIGTVLNGKSKSYLNGNEDFKQRGGDQ